jgi:ABC-type hemin transport system ATPase subunit
VLLNAGKVVADGTPDAVMQPATLEQVYAWPIAVMKDPTTNTPTLFPLRS